MNEIPLAGGTANPGRIARVGDEVARPMHPQTPLVELFLNHLRGHGLSWVPEPRPHDAENRQRLSWIPGIAIMSPAPEWAWSTMLLVDVASHQRMLHEAAADFEAPNDARWAISAGDYFPDDACPDDVCPEGADILVCHNDLSMSNIIVDPASRRLVGIVDFDYCRPVDRLFDIAVAARHWAPVGDPFAAGVPDGLDRLSRFAIICDVHELNAAERGRVVDLGVGFLDKALVNVQRFAADGHPGFRALVDRGYAAANRAATEWLVANKETLRLTGKP